MQVDDGRGGFVLRARSDEVPRRRGSLVESSSNIKKVFKVRPRRGRRRRRRLEKEKKKKSQEQRGITSSVSNITSATHNTTPHNQV